MKITLLMATYNEYGCIDKTIEKLYNYAKENLKDFQIIVIDDGSSDHTFVDLQKAESRYGITIGKNPVNMGQGAAFRRGLVHADGEVVITLDSDLSYPITDIPKLLEKIEGGYDVVVTSPFIGGGGTEDVPFLRLFLSNLATFLYSLALGLKLTAFTGVFRAYRTEVLRNTRYKSDRFEAQVEILWLCKKAGAKIVEIPSVLKFKTERNSNFRVFRDVKTHLVLITRLFFDRALWVLGGSKQSIKK
ncbi:MAG: glycosyltransferase family 2 protein [Candidatus Micrarchaeota archaeon]